MLKEFSFWYLDWGYILMTLAACPMGVVCAQKKKSLAMPFLFILGVGLLALYGKYSA